MSNGSTDSERRQSAVALVSSDGALRAVEVRRKGAGYEVIVAVSGEQGRSEWRQFASQVDVPAAAVNASEESQRKVVVGFDSSSVAFYRIAVPAAAGEEMGAIVQMQAETRLPLPSAQMQITWRKGATVGGETAVTMVAGRTSQLEDFVGQVRSLEPDRILLDCEGVVRAWQELFGAKERDAVLLNILEDSTQVCLVEDGRLANAGVLDIGRAGFGDSSAELFVQDMRSMLDLFGGAGDLPVVVLSDGGAGYSAVADCLTDEGFSVSISEPRVGVLTGAMSLSVEDIYDYRAALGLALIELDRRGSALNLFDKLYVKVDRNAERLTLLSLKVMGPVAALMLIVFLLATYIVDLVSPGAVEQQMAAAAETAKVSVDDLQAKQKLIRKVAQLRPNILELITEVNASGPRGLVLDSINYKAGSAVTITGVAQSNDQMYEFQRKLLERDVFKNVEIKNATNVSGSSSRSSGGSNGGPGGRGGGGAPSGRGGNTKVKFTVSLEYRNFSKK